MKSMKIMSLFAGCGGMDLGFLLAKTQKMGYEIAWANDFDKSACDTYRKNFNHDITGGDIWEIDFSKIPKVDVVIGGFPCEDFSLLRGEERPGFKSKRGLLYTRFVEAVSKKLPLFFVAENVKGLLSLHKGWAIEKIKEDFEKVDDAGYNVQYKLIDFADFGVPQHRERVIIVGIRNDLNIKFSFPKPTHAEKPYKTVDGKIVKKWINSKDALEGIENVKANNEKPRIKSSTIEKIKSIPPGGNYKNIPNHDKRNWMSLIYKRLHPNRPSPTIVACGGGGTWGYHYKEPRPLTNRERARLQTFPDNFEFCGSITDVRKQIGNAVPPLGIKPVAEQLLKAVENRIA